MPDALRLQLRRGWETLERSRGVWSGLLRDCGPLLENLRNLAEQLAALARVRVADTPLRGFPDLRERLRFKLLLEADAVMRRLREHVYGSAHRHT